MSKQTLKKKLSSKKNYSFTGYRVIGENKSNHLKSKSESESEGSTTDDMKSILNSEIKKNHLSETNQMGMPGMNQMGMPGMNMMGAQQNMNMNDIDSLMVNTMAPINNSSMNLNAKTLMNPTQMASNLGSLAKLSNSSFQENKQVSNNLNFKNLAKLNM